MTYAAKANDVNRIRTILPELVARAHQVYTDMPSSILPHSVTAQYLSGSSNWRSEGFPKVLDTIKQTAVYPLRPYMNDLRLFKSEGEIRNMRKAGQASGRAFTEAMRNNFKLEKDLWAFLEYRFKTQGSDRSAYVPVVAGGKNALSIHYVRNDDVLSDDKLVLVDAGGEYGGYVTDITRTWPVSGKFSAAQKDLYEMILGVQRSCISLCRENADMSLDKLHKTAEKSLKEGLADLGFNMAGDVCSSNPVNVHVYVRYHKLSLIQALISLFPHHLGHHIGLDVHDLPGYSRKSPLLTGQCVTIEP